jgi:pyruvate/2-oxoglutarate dehydrogenase complex dihydrolipoamide dehydrogenase (E3) component
MESLRDALAPWDEHNQRLAANVHPADWANPMPAGRYNLVVIGAGTAGLVTAAGAAGLGAKVALIERHLMGGDCLNVGCVPSKALIRSARAAKDARNGERFGVKINGPVEVDFAAVMNRLREVRARISPADSARRFRELGVDVFIGEGRFIDAQTTAVGDAKLSFAKAVIATGARAIAPAIPGLAEVGYLTNENVFNLTERPRRLAVIGGGPIGCELAQAFALLGSEVTLLHNKGHVLDREDADAASLVQAEMQRDGVKLLLDAHLKQVTRGNPGKTLLFEIAGTMDSIEVDEILVGAGRAPNVKGLNLEGVGVRFDERRGIEVDDFLQTANPNIFAAGDVCLRWKFTHAADFAARIVIQNALFAVGGLGRKRLSSLTMPWCTYTDPEIAHIGLSKHEAVARGIALDVWKQGFEHVDRAITDGEERGFVKILTERGKGRILGATIVARHAGELISELSTAMAAGVTLGKLASVIHPYPTQAEAIRKCGDQFNKTRLTPTVKKLFAKWLAWRR